jgi:hypothetical protein
VGPQKEAIEMAVACLFRNIIELEEVPAAIRIRRLYRFRPWRWRKPAPNVGLAVAGEGDCAGRDDVLPEEDMAHIAINRLT